MTLFWTESMPAAKGAAAAGRRSTIAKAVADRTRALPYSAAMGSPRS